MAPRPVSLQWSGLSLSLFSPLSSSCIFLPGPKPSAVTATIMCCEAESSILMKCRTSSANLNKPTGQQRPDLTSNSQQALWPSSEWAKHRYVLHAHCFFTCSGPTWVGQQDQRQINTSVLDSSDYLTLIQYNNFKAIINLDFFCLFHWTLQYVMWKTKTSYLRFVTIECFMNIKGGECTNDHRWMPHPSSHWLWATRLATFSQICADIFEKTDLLRLFSPF